MGGSNDWVTVSMAIAWEAAIAAMNTASKGTADHAGGEAIDGGEASRQLHHASQSAIASTR